MEIQLLRGLSQHTSNMIASRKLNTIVHRVTNLVKFLAVVWGCNGGWLDKYSHEYCLDEDDAMLGFDETSSAADMIISWSSLRALLILTVWFLLDEVVVKVENRDSFYCFIIFIKDYFIVDTYYVTIIITWICLLLKVI